MQCARIGQDRKDSAAKTLERVFTDVMGPFRVELLPGLLFCIMFADQQTKFVFVDLLKAKGEALTSLKKFVLSRRPRRRGKTMQRNFAQSS